MKTRFITLAILLETLPGCAQTWFKVAVEGDKVTTTAPVTYRFGTANCATATGCWTASTSTSVPLASLLVSYTTLSDPAPTIRKELDLLETASPQAVTVRLGLNLNIATVTVPADPALIPPSQPPTPPPPPTPPALVPPTEGMVYPVTLSDIQPIANSLAAVLLQRIPVSPNLVIGGVLSGFSFNLTIGGTRLACLYGGSYAGTATLDCVVTPQ